LILTNTQPRVLKPQQHSRDDKTLESLLLPECNAKVLSKLRNSKNTLFHTPEPSVRPVTHTHPFNGPLLGTTRVSQYQKGKTNLDFTEARDSEWQWHQPGHMQV